MRKTLDDTAVKRILDRAVQLDAERTGSLEPDQVHSIAAELGISREAVDVALAEYQDTLATKSESRGITRRSIVVGAVATITLLGALAFGIGRTAPRPAPLPVPAPPAPPVETAPVPPVTPVPPALPAPPAQPARVPPSSSRR